MNEPLDERTLRDLGRAQDVADEQADRYRDQAIDRDAGNRDAEVWEWASMAGYLWAESVKLSKHAELGPLVDDLRKWARMALRTSGASPKAVSKIERIFNR